MMGSILGRALGMVWLGLSLAAAAQTASPPAGEATPTVPPRLPLASFARLPLLSHVALSPDGQQIAALLNLADRTALIARPVAGQKPRTLLASDNKKFQFNWARWANNERLLVSIRFASRRDFVGTVETRLLSIKADDGSLLNLVRSEPGSGSLAGAVRVQQVQDRVIDWMPEDGRHVLLQLGSPENPLPAVYKVDINSGERRMVKTPERHVYHWFSDAQHRVRVAVRVDEGVYEVRASDPDGGNWRTLWTFESLADTVWPLGFGLDPQELFVSADHEGRRAVFSVRLDQPGLPRTLRLAHPHFDVEGSLLRSPASGEVIGLRNSGTESDSGESRSELWEKTWRAQARAIDLALPDRENRLVGISRDEQRYVLHSSGNGQPGEYFLGDRRGGELSLIGETYPDLDPAMLAGKQATTIKARDGLSLKAYLTLPPGHRQNAAAAPLPLVLLPHGGPHSRDDLDFDAWTEFLANRRYAVLQVNFRGSDGYGSAFKQAGLQRWGLEMQDDLSDAVQWAVAQGIADPLRVCIVGASYGGYAALMGAVKTPELYRCAVSFAGVSDLQDLIAHQGEYIGGRAAAERSIGRAWGDRERLRATSPALQAQRIQVPVLLVHGTADRVVPVEQSADMAKALRRAGKPHQYIEQEDGDHHLSRNSHRLEFFAALERFLDAQLQPPDAR
jgi:dienelactone hydrolase